MLRSRLVSFLNSVTSRYPSIFVAVFIVALLLPLQGFTGNAAELEAKFWGYQEMHWAYSAIRQHLFKDIYFENVVLSENNWLIWTSPASVDDYQNVRPFTAKELAEIQSRLDQVKQQLDAQGVTFLVVIPPNKNTIYPETVPTQIPVLGAQSRLDQLLAYQKQHGKTRLLDLRPALLEEKHKRQIYFATDTHWNSYGAFTATREILLALQSDYPDLKPDDLADFEKRNSKFQLTDMGNIFIPSAAPEEWYVLTPKSGWPMNFYALSDGMPKVSEFVNWETGLPRATIYHDSFMLPLQRFLAMHFSKSTFIWSYAVDPVFIQSEKDDIVILEVTERFIPKLLSSPAPIID